MGGRIFIKNAGGVRKRFRESFISCTEEKRAVTGRLAVLYGLSLDELVEFDIDIKEVQEVIDRTSEEVSDKVDWTKAWSRKYPVLSRYQEEVDTACYAAELDKLLRDLEKKYGYNELDSMLVLKDILASVWKGRKI